jgi:hypothetical protein
VLLLKGIGDLFFGSTTVSDALLKPKKRGISLVPYQHIGIKLILITNAILFVVYTGVVVRALAYQPVGDGWTYIKNDPWSYVTFLDNMILREQKSVWRCALWVLSLFFLGNGVTVSVLSENY